MARFFMLRRKILRLNCCNAFQSAQSIAPLQFSNLQLSVANPQIFEFSNYPPPFERLLFFIIFASSMYRRNLLRLSKIKFKNYEIRRKTRKHKCR